MNKLKQAVAALLLLVCVPMARANSDPVTLETHWNEKTVSIAYVGVTTFTFDVGGFGPAGFAINGGTQVLNGVDGTVYGSTVPIVLNSSTTAPAQNVVGFDYSFLAIGSTCTLKIAQTLKTPPPIGIGIRSGNTGSITNYNSPYPAANFALTAPVISTSSAILMPSNVLYTHTFRAKVTNPIFIGAGLTPGTTYLLTVDYGVPNIQ